jgi:serine/threonine protein kinase
LGFSAPEQLSDAFGQLSVATDIYGLGGVLYYLFVGRPPYSGGDAASVIAAVLSSQQLSCPLDWPPSARSAWPLVARCLSKEIANRPRDVRAVAHEMAALLRAEQ